MKQIIIRKNPIPALNSRVSLMGYESYDISIPSLEKADSVLKEALNETVPFETSSSRIPATHGRTGIHTLW